ncbi:hypothetical protein [Endozoicomonas sp. SCSIO W0465]|uniref:hypothetical protein n=1 Tax=Endozoicomonas sp. SCSIO W0465 TaxID=2918516 RepID=UPI002075DEBC|nr:hypothetical protein [Endozoicomonas sp. SCSIO W0465]USE35311.1 hypothetical protein MJO57_24915 [Endozoicomonas sp. SCSIO W0465]
MKGISKLSLAMAMAGYGVTAMAAVEDAGHVNMGPVEVTPMAALAIGHDDNIFREGEGELADKSSTVVDVDASVAFKAQQGMSTYEAKLAAKNTSFTSVSDANFTDYGVTGLIHQEFNSRNRLDVDFDLGRYHDAGSTVDGADNKEAPEFTRTKGGLKYGFGSTQAMMRADLFGNYNKQTYQEAAGEKEGSDRKSVEYVTTVFYRFMPKTDALVEIKQRELDYTNEQGAGYDITSYLVGLSWEATAKTSGYAKLGRRYRDTSASDVDRQGYTGWEMGVSYMPVDHSVFQLSTSRDYGLESENPQTADFTQGTTSSVSWNHQWTGKISTNANYSFTDEEVQNRFGVSQKDRTINQFGLSVNWNVMRNVTVSLAYENSDRDESARQVAVDEDGYQRNVYMLSGTVAL